MPAWIKPCTKQSAGCSDAHIPDHVCSFGHCPWLQRADLHRRSSGYEPGEMLLLHSAIYGGSISAVRKDITARDLHPLKQGFELPACELSHPSASDAGRRPSAMRTKPSDRKRVSPPASSHLYDITYSGLHSITFLVTLKRVSDCGKGAGVKNVNDVLVAVRHLNCYPFPCKPADIPVCQQPPQASAVHL